MGKGKNITVSNFEKNLTKTIDLLSKGEKVKPMDQNLSARRKEYDDLNKKNFGEISKWYESNDSLILKLQKAFESWESHFSDAEKKSTEYKSIGFYVKKLSEKPKERERPKQESSSGINKGNSDGNQAKPVSDTTKNNIPAVEPMKKDEERPGKTTRNLNPHRQKLEDSPNYEKLLQHIQVLEHNVARNIDETKREISRSIDEIIRNQNKPSIDMDKKLRDMSKDIALDVAKLSRDQSGVNAISEVIEALPSQMKKITEKIDLISEGIESSGTTNINRLKEVPKDEKAVLLLTEYMRDGLGELENIARYYIQNQENLEKKSEKLEQEETRLKSAKDEGYAEGYKKAQVDMAKKIYEKFPEAFEKVISVFEEDGVVVTKYETGEVIAIDNENRRELEIEIEGILAEGEVTIDKPALVLNNEVLRRATLQSSQTEE